MSTAPLTPDPAAVFAERYSACLRRFLAQNDRPALAESDLAALSARMWRVVVRETAVPPPPSEWTEIPAARIEAMTREILDEAPAAERRPDLEVPVRQLLKGGLQAEPVRCRESYREVAGGICRRQDLARTRGRVSGAHCVDCPHWTGLDSAKNTALMERAWVEGPVARFEAHRDIFLPEDFRALRTWVRRLTVRSV